MAGSLNRASLIGNVGKDPEMRRTQDGRPIANFSVATSESWRDKASGERREKTEWHRVVCFNEALCKIIEQYVRKGSKVMIEGAIQTRKWTDQGGVERYSTEIVMQGFGASILLLTPKGDREEGGRSAGDRDDGRPASTAAPAGGSRSLAEELDDEIPF